MNTKPAAAVKVYTPSRLLLFWLHVRHLDNQESGYAFYGSLLFSNSTQQNFFRCVSITQVMVCTSASSSVVWWASPGSLIEMQMPGPHASPTASETLGWAQESAFNKPPPTRGCWCSQSVRTAVLNSFCDAVEIQVNYSLIFFFWDI